MSGSRYLYRVSIDSLTYDSLTYMMHPPSLGDTFKGNIITAIEYHSPTQEFFIETMAEEEQEEVTYINGDIVEATSTGEVFLYIGSMWYNLSSGRKEMRGRKHIQSQYGPLKKLANMANSGDLFKQAHLETIPPF